MQANLWGDRSKPRALFLVDFLVRQARFRLAKFPGSTTLVGLHFEITHR